MTFTRKIFMATSVTMALFTATLYLSCKKETPDPCKGINCLNAGACNTGKCVCPTGYTGVYCETVVDPCANTVCQNGGTCNDGDCFCPTGTTGTLCETVYRDAYTNTYVGNGTDNGGNTYTNFRFAFASTGLDLTKMQLTLMDNVGLVVLQDMPITLTSFSASGSSYTIAPYTQSGYTYTGNGTVSSTLASTTLYENSGTLTTTYTFTNLSKH